jgi:hypothetical protein
MDLTVGHIPIVTTVLAWAFAPIVFQRYRQKARTDGSGSARHLLWWSIGIFMFGVGTFTEGFTTLFGWHEPVFRSWYISGALLGGAPLAQGSVYLLFSRRTADRMTIVVFSYIAIAAVLVAISPIDAAKAADDILRGDVIEWSALRLLSIPINSYAAIMLIGGAAYSAYRFWRVAGDGNRAAGNALIAVGALLPGIGGGFSRAGYTEVLYVGEFIGLILIYFGYRLNVAKRQVAVEPAPEASPAG